MSWSDLERRLDTDAAALFDEVTFTVAPRTKGATVNDRPGPDGARAAFDFKGSLDLNPPPLRNEPLGGPTGVFSGETSFDGVVTAHDDGTWPYVPGRPDHLTAGGVTYQIADTHRDGSARRVFYVNKAK